MKKTNRLRYVLPIIFGMGLMGYLAVNSWSLSRAGYKNISPDQLAEMMRSKDFVLINVHIPYEGEIPKTDLLIPFNAVEKFREKFPDKGTKIVLYCVSGGMSRFAANNLANMGYTRIYNLQYGMRGWMGIGKHIVHRFK